MSRSLPIEKRSRRLALRSRKVLAHVNPTPAAAVASTAMQAVGGIGALKWMSDGVLNPGATGEVNFRGSVE